MVCGHAGCGIAYRPRRKKASGNLHVVTEYTLVGRGSERGNSFFACALGGVQPITHHRHSSSAEACNVQFTPFAATTSIAITITDLSTDNMEKSIPNCRKIAAHADPSGVEAANVARH